MFQENEIIEFVISFGILIFVLVNASHLREIIPRFRFFLLGFLCLFFSEICTNLEAVAWPEFLNFCEHAGYALSTYFLAVWCFLNFFRKGNTA